MTPTATEAAHARTLKAIHDSLFAPRFDALETYGQPKQPDPTAEDVRMAVTATLKWQRDNEVKLACEVSERRKASNVILLDAAVQALAFCRSEIARLQELKAEMDAQHMEAAE